MNVPVAQASKAPSPHEVSSRLPVMVAATGHGVILSADGEIETLTAPEITARLHAAPHIVCNLPLVARRLRQSSVAALDVLELFAFVRPGRFCLPVPEGLGDALGLKPGGDALADKAILLMQATQNLLSELAAPDYAYPAGAGPLARKMAEAGWGWGPYVLQALGPDAANSTEPGMDVWNAIPEWEDEAPPPPPGVEAVTEAEIAFRLNILIGPDAERRAAQKEYAAMAGQSFAPPQNRHQPNIVLAEAGTGTGKTLGYIAPASLWAEKNEGTVWLSTYTKNLQRQLDQELDRLYPDPEIKARKAVLRKGRENYLCLLNMQEASVSATPPGRILLGLVARWARYSRDGEMIGGDFPAWLGAHFGRGRLAQLTDRRGECIYSACAHYRRCFIERVVRKSRHADLVIANHALVMINAATRQEDSDLPRRYVFDEGHHLFDAADSAFSVHLTGQEGAELRRWLRGAEQSRSRARGLRRRIEDLIAGDDGAEKLVGEILKAAQILPGEGWLARIAEGTPFGPAEAYLALVRGQVLARARDDRMAPDDIHGLETPVTSPVDGLLAAALTLRTALEELASPLKALRTRLMRKLDKEADELDSNTRARIEAISRSLKLREEIIDAGWCNMLKSLDQTLNLNQGATDAFVDWFSLERAHGRELDVGMHRHWVDPSAPFAGVVLQNADGALITSATLRDGEAGADDWQSAEVRTGASHMLLPPARISLASPFDYKNQTRVFIVNDLGRGNVDALSAAYRELFLAAGGGALGLFTAIARLRAVYDHISAPLEEAGLPLYAQHIDPMDTGTLVDIFRAEEHSCLLGTDAIRDGVDVPGRSLRLLVFDKVPWPRPTILHKARRKAYGATAYDDMMTRLRFKQAFGRLIRRADDKGVFVLLDGAMPSRLLSAFPPDTIIERVGLAEAIAKTRDFLAEVEND
jgi:ATP-dependent DNA helicase DinG